MVNLIAFLFLLGAPRIVCENNVFDFGRVEAGAVIKHVFVVKNAGDETLEIKKVWTSCGCTAANTGKKKLKPGDTTCIRVTFKTKGYSGKTTKAIFLKTNDPENSIYVLKLQGYIVKYAVTPEELLRSMCLIFDLRSKKEFKKMHLLGAIHIEKKKFLEEFDKLFIPKNTAIVIVYSGERPLDILETLRKKGYKSTYLLEGGMANWYRVYKFTLTERNE